MATTIVGGDPRCGSLLLAMAALELSLKLGYAHICARYEANNAEQYQARVLPQSPLEAPEARILVIHGQLDHRGHNHAQCAEADGADERDEWTKIGQCHSDATAENLEKDELSTCCMLQSPPGTYHQGHTQSVFADVLTRSGDLALNALPQDADGHVELQREGEENGNGDH